MTIQRTVRGIGTCIVVVLAVLAAVYALQPEWLRRQVTRWFGPPQVELEEAYAGIEGGEVFDHGAFDRLVREFVDEDGFVDYRGLAARAGELDAYIASLSEADLDALGRDERLALLINAYNAFTLQLILDHYPIDSIRDIPGEEIGNIRRGHRAL